DAEQVIFDSLRWLGMDWDEGPDIGGPCGPYTQSERLDIYRQKAAELIDKGWAYRCNCTPERLDQVRDEQRARGETPKYDGHCRNLTPDAIAPDEPHVIRLKVPQEGTTIVHDSLRGDIVFDNTLLDDQILLKSDGFPTYHLAVVIDDHLMGITHVLRGDDWISSTPKRVLLYRAFGWQPPVYAHVPLVLGADGKKLGKRHGAISIAEFRRMGYLPEAVFNFLALVGWSPGEGEEQEVFTREELIQKFDIERINLAPAVFSYEKLDWMNGVYIRNLSREALLQHLIPFWVEAGFIPYPVPAGILRVLEIMVPLVQERLKHLTDVVELTDFIFTDIATPSPEDLIPKKTTPEQSLEIVRAIVKELAKLVSWDAESMEPALREMAAELNVKAGQVFNIIRVATSNKRVAPPLFGCLEALGRETTLKRLGQAEDVLVSHIAQQGS
ncbi:MAG: glutamate--tRNA ligase, partial [Anaerolineae bacterium]|nr:glutamate--tRNA ligase [Anaerolineae bacterium]